MPALTPPPRAGPHLSGPAGSTDDSAGGGGGAPGARLPRSAGRSGQGRLPAWAPLRAVPPAVLFFQEPCRFRYIHSRTMGLNTNRYHPN